MRHVSVSVLASNPPLLALLVILSTPFPGWTRLAPVAPVAPELYNWSYTNHQLISHRCKHTPPHADRSPSAGTHCGQKGTFTVYMVLFGRFAFSFCHKHLLSTICGSNQLLPGTKLFCPCTDVFGKPITCFRNRSRQDEMMSIFSGQ